MRDAVPRVEGEPSDAGVDHGTRKRVQREPMFDLGLFAKPTFAGGSTSGFQAISTVPEFSALLQE